MLTVIFGCALCKIDFNCVLQTIRGLYSSYELENGALSLLWSILTHFQFINRGLFIIDDKGILRQITVNDLPVGRSVDETLRLVQAFQFVDKHGEVCPAGWKPGSDTVSFLSLVIHSKTVSTSCWHRWKEEEI